MALVLTVLIAARQRDETFVLKGAGAQARDDGLKAAAEGRYKDAVPLLQKATKGPPMGTLAEKMMVARMENTLGGALKALGRSEEAVAAFQRAHAVLEPLGDDGMSDLIAVTNNWTILSSYQQQIYSLR